MKITLFVISLFSISCSGELFFGDSDLRVSDEHGVFQNGDAKNNSTGPIINTTTGMIDPVRPEPKNTYLVNASSGTRCIEGSRGDYVVLSDEPVSCGAHALAVDAFLRNETIPGVLVFDSDELQTEKSYCFIDSSLGCEDVAFNVERAGRNGSWAATIQDREIIQTLEIQDCDFDSVVPPESVEIPATDISITEVSFYQGVKIPVFQNGQFLTDRQTPLIAKRPGVVRVFVEPQVGWESREIVARLTVGEFTKEIVFSPTGNSDEMSGASTINFELAQGELPGNGVFSVSLFEAEQCSDRPAGTPAVSSVPDVPQELGVEELAAPMKIMLVPMVYNADGSGRTPRVDANVAKAFQDLANEYYPVHEVILTVRDQPVQYSGGISPNGTGFSQALNFCLNQRSADGVDNDVYYYCMYQPAETIQQFCGGGCVAGIAPVPPANNVGLRGGIGVSFNGSGADTFVHEVGHALGRPHSPCGGASGTDPNYPYQGGSIGSIGYSILSGQLVSPAQAKDFMSYCNPVWISDYSYARIYDRLSQVIGIQQAQSFSAPKNWKTAIVEMDGTLNWDIDRSLKTLPSGQKISAQVFNEEGNKLGNVDVYVVAIADVNTSILTIEDPGFSGGSIIIPNLGTLDF